MIKVAVTQDSIGRYEVVIDNPKVGTVVFDREDLALKFVIELLKIQELNY